MKSKLELLYLSFFGVGYAPKAPGTFGSIATLPFMYLFSLYINNLFILIILTLSIIISSSLITEKIQKERGLHDPQWIVIDEVAGMLCTWIIVFPSLSLKSSLAILIAFRFFDIIKFWPASFFDNKVHHGSGTILDDVISGIYAGISLRLINIFLPILN